MSTRVKICGISTVESAHAAATAGADLLGFIFYPPSPRHITPAAARTIVRALRGAGHATLAVGLFVDAPPEQINAVAATVGLDLIQLSGDEHDADLARIALPIVRAVRLAPGTRPPRVHERLTRAVGATARRGPRAPGPLGQTLTPLLDAHVPGAYGGTGTRADWSAAAALARRWRLFLAGGLTPENVGRAIREVGPFGVDVSSGVESGGGKDPAKICAFLAAVREADATRGAVR